MAKVPYIPVTPVTLVCPQCGAPYENVAAKKKPGKTPYGKDKKRRLKKILERMKRKT